MNAINTISQNCDISTSLSSELLDELQRSLTWAGNSLLQAIYANSRIQHKELSDILDTSPSSLSNLVSKIQTTYKLIHTEKIGRSKYYTLTDLGSEYVKLKLSKNRSLAPIQPFTPASYTESLIAKALHTFQQFKNAAGVNWYFHLYNFLTESVDENSSLQGIYCDFLDKVYELRIQNQTALNEVYKYINNEEIVTILKERLNRHFKNYELLEPLFTLEKSNQIAALTIIDYVFDDMHSSTSEKQPQRTLENCSISQNQYYAIFYCITRMVTEYTQQVYNKSSALEYWYTVYHTKSIVLFYIAEKCSKVHCVK